MACVLQNSQLNGLEHAVASMECRLESRWRQRKAMRGKVIAEMLKISFSLKEIAMKCPTCPDATLLMSERQGVEIDYCPTCRGVWLDRGELDKLIALSAGPAPAQAAQPPASAQPSYAPQTPQGYGKRPDFYDSDFGKHQGGYRKKSWLKDIFD
jgi:uncharacterized protein